MGLNAYIRGCGIIGQMPVVTNLYGEYDVFGEVLDRRRGRADQEARRCPKLGGDRVVCWGTVAPCREFIYSGDAAEAVVRLLKSGYTEPLNIGTGVGTSIKELAEMVARLTGFRGEIYGDTSKADGVHPQGARRLADGERAGLEATDQLFEAGLAQDDPLVSREQVHRRRSPLTALSGPVSSRSR